jgi:hypothetical protein
MLGLDMVEHAFAEGVFSDVNLRVVLQRNWPVPSLDPVCRVYQDLGNGLIFRPDTFTKTDCPRVNGEGEKRHGVSSINLLFWIDTARV